MYTFILMALLPVAFFLGMGAVIALADYIEEKRRG